MIHPWFRLNDYSNIHHRLRHYQHLLRNGYYTASYQKVHLCPENLTISNQSHLCASSQIVKAREDRSAKHDRWKQVRIWHLVPTQEKVRTDGIPYTYTKWCCCQIHYEKYWGEEQSPKKEKTSTRTDTGSNNNCFKLKKMSMVLFNSNQIISFWTRTF